MAKSDVAIHLISADALHLETTGLSSSLLSLHYFHSRFLPSEAHLATLQGL
jgi:hypothetical protein